MRLRLVALAGEHRRYRLPWLTVLLRCEGGADNKWFGRIYLAANFAAPLFDQQRNLSFCLRAALCRGWRVKYVSVCHMVVTPPGGRFRTARA